MYYNSKWAFTDAQCLKVGRKRILVSGEYHHVSEIAELVRNERPD